MSRSRPQEDRTPNPAVRWFEWNGGKEGGTVRHYDKVSGMNVEGALPFRFIVLDQLGTVGGWHKTSDCRISANQVRPGTKQPFVVRTKKDGVIAEGLWKDIKDRLAAVDGYFVANVYIGFKTDDVLVIGVLQLKGSALRSWTDFKKKHADEIGRQSVEIVSFEEDKKGSIVYRTPVFAIRSLSPATDKLAHAIDEKLQRWLDGYFSRSKRDQVEKHEHDQTSGREPGDDDERGGPSPLTDGDLDGGITDDDIPF